MIRQKTSLAAVAIVLGSVLAPKAQAAQVAGVALPDTEKVGSQTLMLNGIGLRTYSIMHVHIYVAGLYLTRPMRNGELILQSPDTKVLWLHFVHNVDVSKIRQAWKTGLTDNCEAPCKLSDAELEQFLGALQPVSEGENITLVFKGQELDAYENGQLIGRVNDPQFARLMLAVFIGPHVETPRLKSELLGLASPHQN